MIDIEFINIFYIIMELVIILVIYCVLEYRREKTVTRLTKEYESLSRREDHDYSMTLKKCQLLDENIELLNKTQSELFDLVKGLLPDEAEIRARKEISSREQYLTDPKAKKLWEFLIGYCHLPKDGNECITIPAFRVLDALSMINQDKIEYSAV